MLLANFLAEYLFYAFPTRKVPCSIRTLSVFLFSGTMENISREVEKNAKKLATKSSAQLQKVTINRRIL